MDVNSVNSTEALVIIMSHKYNESHGKVSINWMIMLWTAHRLDITSASSWNRKIAWHQMMFNYLLLVFLTYYFNGALPVLIGLWPAPVLKFLQVPFSLHVRNVCIVPFYICITDNTPLRLTLVATFSSHFALQINCNSLLFLAIWISVLFTQLCK